MKKKILGLLIATMIAIPAYANITVSPTRLEINANKVRSNYATTAVDVRGSNQKAVRYRAYTEYFEIDENAKMKNPDGKNNPHNIASKLRFVPSEFTVPAVVSYIILFVWIFTFFGLFTSTLKFIARIHRARVKSDEVFSRSLDEAKFYGEE